MKESQFKAELTARREALYVECSALAQEKYGRNVVDLNLDEARDVVLQRRQPKLISSIND